MNKSQIIADSLTSFRARITELESKLSVSVLYGQGYMVLAQTPGMESDLVLGRFDRPGHYAANSPQVFCSLDITPDHLCGVSLYDRETADKVIAQCQADPALSTLSFYRTRHIRTEQERRLTNWKDMVRVLEAIPA